MRSTSLISSHRLIDSLRAVRTKERVRRTFLSSQEEDIIKESRHRRFSVLIFDGAVVKMISLQRAEVVELADTPS